MVNDNPLAILWTGKCTISEYKKVTNPDNFQTTHELVPVVTDEPCRLSHNRETTINVNNGAPYVAQTILLFIRPDLTIKDGSVLEVTQHGVTNKYKRSGKPSIYTNHQEIALELYEDRA